MFRSGIELELLAQAKIDDLYTNYRQSPVPAGPAKPTIITSIRRRFGLRLIAAGTRLVGSDLPAAARPAVASR